MTINISVTCETTTSIPEEGYRSEDDLFRNAALVPTHLLDKLNIDPFDYLEVREQSESEDWSEGVYVQAVPLADEFEYQNRESGGTIYMRTNILRAITESLNPGDIVDVRRTDIKSSPPLRVKRSYADDRLGERCYISAEIRSQIGLNEYGDPVEIVHPEKGARTILPAWQLRDWDDKDHLGLDLHSRELLGVETGDMLRVQCPVYDLVAIDNGPEPSFQDTLKTKFLEFFIDRQKMSLRVMRGPNQDEHRNIARINQNVMEVLGIEPGELAKLRWKGRTHTVQMLLPPEEKEVPKLSILLPSTERDQIGISIGDAVVAYRDMSYYFKKNIITSLFGVIGVVIGIFQVVSTLEIVNRYESIFGYPKLVAALILVSVLISLAVIWIILYPERQAVTKSEPRE